MNAPRLGTVRTWMAITLFLMIVIGLAINIFMTIRMSAVIDDLRTRSVGTSRLPCPAVPARLILEDPNCAQKLLHSMNVTNVRIHAAYTKG